MRFRNYLAEQYKKEDIIEGTKEILPISTIYILGFNIPEVNSACIHAERQYRDLVNNEPLLQKSDFIEKLTHDSYVVQVNRITDRYKTRLDQLLSVFEQTNFVDDSEITKEYTHQINEEDVKLITTILHHSGTDPETRREIEIEAEAWRSVNAMFDEKEREYLKVLEEKDKALEEKDKTIDEKDKALEEKDKLIEELKRKLDQQSDLS